MDKFIVQFLFFAFCFYYNKNKKGSWFVPSNFIFGLYTLCTLLAMPTIYDWDLKQALGAEYWVPLIVFDLCVFLFIFPFFSLNEGIINTIVLPSQKKLNLFTNVIIILSLFSIIYYIPTVSDILLMENLAMARTDVELGTQYQTPGLLNTIASVASSLNIFAIVLFFIYSVMGCNKIKLILLFISSLSEPIQVLTFVGRDGVVFWIFATIFCFLLFRPYLSDDLRTKYTKYIVGATCVVLIPFMLISISRFGESDMGFAGALTSYLGQGFVNGPLLFGINNLQTTGGGCFPLFFEITGITPPADLGRVQIGDWCSWYFSTSIGQFYRNVGAFGLCILLFIHNFYFKLRVSKNRSTHLPFHKIILYLLYFRIVSEGVFYFREGTRGGNLFILLMLYASVYFRIKNKTNAINLKRLQ